MDNDKPATVDINVNNSESISILDNEKDGSKKSASKKYKKKKNKSKKSSQNSDLTTTSTTSSKDTTVESDTNELNGLGGRVRPQPQVSRLPGQIKPKRWQKWNWRSHTVPTSTSTACAASTASAASSQT